MSSNRARGVAGSGAPTFLLAFLASTAHAAPDLSGVWGMVQHDRLGAPFFIPIEPKLNEAGKAATDAFKAKYDVVRHEANGACVEPGMPTVMCGIGGAAMEVVQQPQRITLLSELANQSRRIFLDGRAMPDSFPDQRVGFCVGHWDGDTLVIETSNVSEWQAPRWPHSGEFHVTERWHLFVRSEMMPLARKAQQNGTFAGWSVTTSVQGGEPNLITLNMFYKDFAPLDGPPPLAATLGPRGVADFLRKGAGLINQVEQSVLKRVPDLSY